MGSPTRRASTRASEGSRDRFRDGGDSDLEAVGAACGPPELLKLAAEQNPDVVVTDTGMPPTVGVVLSQYTVPAYALALL